jgi:hypothetical protein
LSSPGRHQQKRFCSSVTPKIKTLPQRSCVVGGERSLETLYQGSARQTGGKLGAIEMQHGLAIVKALMFA